MKLCQLMIEGPLYEEILVNVASPHVT